MEDFPEQWGDIQAVLGGFELRKSRIILPGGSKSLIAGQIDRELTKLGWIEKQFATAIHVDADVVESPTHKVDCFKQKVGLEIEWNNKDPFFDRDLNNFRLLFELRALSVGIVVTRGDELQAIFKRLGKGSSYGNSTTHMSKLVPRLDGGGGGGCPVLAFAIKDDAYRDDIADGEIPEFKQEVDRIIAAIKPIRRRFLSAQKRVNKWTDAAARVLEPRAATIRRLEAARTARDNARTELGEMELPEIVARHLDREDLLIADADEDEEENEEV